MHDLVVPGTNGGFSVDYSGGISLYGNEINSGAKGVAGVIAIGRRNTTAIEMHVGAVFAGSASFKYTGTDRLTISADETWTTFAGASGNGLRLTTAGGADWRVHNSGTLQCYGDDGWRIMSTHNTSATGSTLQFYIDHSFGDVLLGNSRGELRLTSSGNVRSLSTFVTGAASNGTVSLVPGSASHPGYVQWHTPGGARAAYLGWATSGSYLEFRSESGWGIQFSNGSVNFASGLTSEATKVRYLEFHGEGGDSGVGVRNYAIYQRAGGWSNPYPDLHISFHTGIALGAHREYGGVTVRESNSDGSIVAQFNGSYGYNYFNNWTNFGGVFGVYSAINNAHLSPNDNSEYGAWNMQGIRNSYAGINFSSGGYRPHVMFDGSGNGGIYWRDYGWWGLYISPANGCTMVGGRTSADSNYGLLSAKSIYAEGNVVAYSDRRMKDEIETVTSALEKVRRMRGVTFVKKGDEKRKRQMGVIAQEMIPVCPEVVDQLADGTYAVAYGNLVGVLIEAIKELEEKLNGAAA